jgi:hypothetical protein
LQTIALSHDALSDHQLRSLGRFRLHQYVLCGFYDPDVILNHGFRVDPALFELPTGTVHFFVGTSEGRILAYSYLQPASKLPEGKSDREDDEHSHTNHRTVPSANSWSTKQVVRMGNTNRPLFPSEYDTFSPEVYTSLPGLRRIPVDQVRELGVLLRNQAVQSPLGSIAAIESIYTMAYLIIHSDSAIQALIGNTGTHARRLMGHLLPPILYAPLVRVVKEQPDYYWVKGTNLTGGFWPFVISGADTCASASYYQALDAVLDGDPRSIRRELIRFSEHARIYAPKAFVPEPDACPILWTADPLYGEPPRVRARERLVVGVTSREDRS